MDTEIFCIECSLREAFDLRIAKGEGLRVASGNACLFVCLFVFTSTIIRKLED